MMENDKTVKLINTIKYNNSEIYVEILNSKGKRMDMSNFVKSDNGGKTNDCLQATCYKKTQKCQPAARDATDLIQTDGIPDSGLSRHNKKNISERKKLKIKKINTVGPVSDCFRGSCYKKTQKCQPAARDATDLIQTDGIPDSGLSRHNKKNIRTKKIKIKNEIWMEKRAKPARNETIWNFTISICMLLLLNGLFLEAWNLTHVRESWSEEYILPQHWPWTNNFWKTGDYTMKSGNIVHLWTHRSWNKLQKVINGNRSMNLQLKVLHWNLGARKWHNKLDDIQILLNDCKPDLCYISEANLWDGLEPHQMELENYKLVLPLTMNSQKHARLVLLVKETLTVTRLDQFMDDKSATIWVRVGNEGRNSIRVGGIYREHLILGEDNQNMSNYEIQRRQEQRWKSIIKNWKAASKDRNCIVLGDINLDFLKWNCPDSSQEEMIHLTQQEIESAGFTQVIDKITRSQINQNDSLIDHVWVNHPGRLLSHVNLVRENSDHNVIGANVTLKEIKTGGNNIIKRRWKNFRESRFIEKLKLIDWEPLYSETDPELANTLFEDTLTAILDSEAPMGVVQERVHYSCWLDVTTKAAMLERDISRELARLSKSPADWDKFRKLKNKVTDMQIKDKKKYFSEAYRKIEEENDTGNLFGMTKKILGWKMSTPPKSFIIDGKPIRSQVEVANVQANFYENKVEGIKNRLPKVRRDPLYFLNKAFGRWVPSGRIPKLLLGQTTELEVLNIIKKFKNSHAFGRDNLDAATIKIGGKYLSRPIAHIVNLSLLKSTFPNKWKIARILPIQKSKGLDLSNPASFRPISQLPVISKITEKIVQSKLLLHLEQHSLLSSDHHGYRLNLSTTSALLDIMEAISNAADQNLVTSTMSLDQTSAFDCVEHKILLSKLAYYHLDESVIDWVRSYLLGRTTFVSVGTAQSKMKNVRYRLPQGSVLGPLLFLLYTNEFSMCVEDDLCGNQCHEDTQTLFGSDCISCGRMTMYADDSQYMTGSKSRTSNQKRLETSFTRINDFLSSNGLELNQGKTTLTEFMTC